MKKFSQLALPYIIWSIIILLLPVLLIAFYAITDRGNTVVNFSFTLQNFVKFFTDPDFLLILWRSLSIALKTTIICILLGYPVAYFISRCKDRTRNILILLITLPMWINMLVRTYAWIGILSSDGIISSFLGQGYLPKDAAILGTYLHGLCGDEVYKENYTVVASKVIDQIPQMMKKLNKNRSAIPFL